MAERDTVPPPRRRTATLPLPADALTMALAALPAAPAPRAMQRCACGELSFSWCDRCWCCSAPLGGTP